MKSNSVHKPMSIDIALISVFIFAITRYFHPWSIPDLPPSRLLLSYSRSFQQHPEIGKECTVEAVETVTDSSERRTKTNTTFDFDQHCLYSSHSLDTPYLLRPVSTYPILCMSTTDHISHYTRTEVDPTFVTNQHYNKHSQFQSRPSRTAWPTLKRH